MYGDFTGIRGVAAADKLAVAAKANDRSAAIADAKAMGDACSACHRGYKAR